MLTSVELYSPNGDCQHQLKPLPIDLANHILAMHGDDLIACAGSEKIKMSIYSFYG